jgi:hypothetical protein
MLLEWPVTGVAGKEHQALARDAVRDQVRLHSLRAPLRERQPMLTGPSGRNAKFQASSRRIAPRFLISQNVTFCSDICRYKPTNRIISFRGHLVVTVF